MATGIDIYEAYQKVDDWHAVRKAGYEFAYVKVTDGMSVRSSADYFPAGTTAGLAMGGYCYAEPGDPIAQANLLIDTLTVRGGLALAPALDLEGAFDSESSAQASAFAIAFLKRVAERGHTPCLYGNNSRLGTILATVKAAVPGLITWVARYGASPTVPYQLWQWSQTGRVAGIRASGVDLDQGQIPYNRFVKTTGGTVTMTSPNGTTLDTPYPDPFQGGKAKVPVRDMIAFGSANAAWAKTAAEAVGPALAIVKADVDAARADIAASRADVAAVRAAVSAQTAALVSAVTPLVVEAVLAALNGFTVTLAPVVPTSAVTEKAVS